MSIFDSLSKKGQSQMPSKQQMQEMANQLRGNPAEFLKSMGYNIPDNLNLNDPNAIINHLMQTSQISGGLLGKAQSLMNLFR